MKKILFAAAVILGCLSFNIAHAQVRFNVNLNIGSQPAWGPVGYDHVDYYYMPDVDAYYDVPSHRYVYYENNVWVHRTYLPARYRNYNVYNGYKVVVNQRSPWLRHSYYRSTYASYRGRGGQPVIRDSRDARYVQHWKGNNGRGPIRGNPGRGPGGNFGRGPGGDRGHHDNGNHGGGKPGGGHGNGHGGGHGNH